MSPVRPIPPAVAQNSEGSDCRVTLRSSREPDGAARAREPGSAAAARERGSAAAAGEPGSAAAAGEPGKAARHGPAYYPSGPGGRLRLVIRRRFHDLFIVAFTISSFSSRILVQVKMKVLARSGARIAMELDINAE
jgi:hypothetical protein